MSEWMAKMPRTAPAEGKAHVVVAVKRGSRMELCGELPADQASVVMMLAQVSHERFLEFKAAIDSVA